MEQDVDKTNEGLQILADKRVIAAGQAGSRIVEINITSPKNEEVKERAPLNLSIVLDRSGSMSGEKLHFVKQAASHVMDLLSEKDRAAVVVYDDNVESVFPSAYMTEDKKLQAKTRIQSVHSGGTTFLSGGWARGCEEVAEAITQNSINRTLLLTDGLANVGERNPDILAAHARGMFERGVSTSCFGVGLGYDEHLLEAIANSGGGNFHFLEAIEAIPMVFEREFEELAQVTLSDVVIRVQPPKGVTLEVLGGWRTEKDQEDQKIVVGSLYAGRKQSIYLRMFFSKDIDEEEIVIPVRVSGNEINESQFEIEQSLVFKVVSFAEEAEMKPDAELMERYALVDMADKATEALKRERAGDRMGASQMVSESLRAHRADLSAAMQQKFEYMAVEMRRGLSEDMRKRHHRQEYENKRGRELVRDYYLEAVDGHLIARIEDKAVLIDTGAPVSVGNGERWYFLNKVHQPGKDYLGVTTEYLTKMVGHRVDLLLGMDILGEFHVTIDLARNHLRISPVSMLQGGVRLHLETMQGVPVCKGRLDGQEIQLFVDTGSKFSYLGHKLVEKFTPAGREKDFFPGAGEFETDVYEVPIQIGKEQVGLRCGVLPKLIEKAVLLTGTRGIIGAELFRKYVVEFAFPEDWMMIRAY